MVATSPTMISASTSACIIVKWRCLLLVVQQWEVLASKVQNILKDYPSLSLTHGRKVCIVSVFCFQSRHSAITYKSP